MDARTGYYTGRLDHARSAPLRLSQAAEDNPAQSLARSVEQAS
jgi:hypothetical protein